MYQRLVGESAYAGAESTVRRYVGRRRRELGLRGEAFVPQAPVAGEEAQVDWYEAAVDFSEGRRVVQFFVMRASYSARSFHMAFERQTQQAFLEGHVAGFEYFDGVFARVRYDNLGSAVKRVLRGRRREETARFIALRSHYLFEAEFCRPGVQGAHEKGGVEGEVGRFRRQHLVPVPAVRDLDELNTYLRRCCAEDDERCVAERTHPLSEDWACEQPQLRPLPTERYPTAEVSTVRVDAKSRVRVRTNHYSVPVRLVGQRVEVQAHARWLVMVHAGHEVARHRRLYTRHGEQLELDHYLELLVHKPGAFPRARALAQARAAGRWPVSYDRLWSALKERYGEAPGTRQLLDVLILHRSAPGYAVHAAVEQALALGCYDAGAIAVLLRQHRVREPLAPVLKGLGGLARYAQGHAVGLAAYDALAPSARSGAVT